MKFNTQSPPIVLCLFFSILIFVSCSKDSDLMADYVALDPEVLIGTFVRSDTYQVSIISNSEDDTVEININSGSSGTITNSGTSGTTVNDTFQTSSSVSIVLDVLANDTFEKPEEVLIIEVSQPNNGNVVINSDNTLTYTPNALVAGEDNFTYTTEFNDENGKLSTETGTVKVEIVSPNAKLLWASGFEGNTVLGPSNGDYQYFSGVDQTTGFDWDNGTELWNSGVGVSGPNGLHRINDDGGSAITNNIITTAGHTGAQTKVLSSSVNYQVSVTQTPYQINQVDDTVLDEYYVKYWAKIDTTNLETHGDYHVLWEYKTDAWASEGPGIGFRGIAGLANLSDAGGALRFYLQGDDDPGNPIWYQFKTTTELGVDLNDWIMLEFYGKMSADAQVGYTGMKVNGQLVGYQQGATYGSEPGDGMSYMAAWQVYGTGFPLAMLVDDVEIWDGVPY